MSQDRDIALISDLCAQSAETSWLGFKGNNADPEMIGKRCSALSNAARVEGRDCAYMIWGIDDNSHQVMGTSFDPDADKARGQVLSLWLANSLQPSIAFSFRVVKHPQGRVVILEIPAATGAEHIGTALREAHPLFPQLAIRELVANALIHQDMTITGSGPQIELFSDRIEISNPGRSLVKPDRMIDLPPRSRNEALASLMRRMKMCEEQGSGLDKVIQLVEVFQLPAPLLRADDNSMQVILYGPRSFAEMTQDERVRACYFHAVLRFLSGDKMKNATLCVRFGIDPRNAAQASGVINKTLKAGLIRHADAAHPVPGMCLTGRKFLDRVLIRKGLRKREAASAKCKHLILRTPR